MIDPVFGLVAAGLVLIASGLLFRPGVGWYWRGLQAVRAGERVRIEDALKHLHECEYQGLPCTLQSLSGALGLSGNRAAGLLDRLQQMELVVPSGAGYGLTLEGRRDALRVIRIHRLWEQFLSEETGVPPSEWHRRAEIEEHRTSPEAVEALAARMGHPRYDPHGDPIPTAGGELGPRRGRPLTEFGAGRLVRIVHVEDEPEAVYDRLLAKGLYPGMWLRVRDASPHSILLEVDTEERVLVPALAANLWVEEVPEERQLDETVERMSALEIGDQATVAGLSARCRGAERRRMLDLGFVPGTLVKAEMRSPGGDPIAFRIRGSMIALRREQADLVQVHRVDQAAVASGAGAAGCADCPAHNLAGLRKLGVNMEDRDYVVALAGNPNTGKSTVFNALTGLRQHTGNWPGKTVSRAEGGFASGDKSYKLVDLPGTYSLLSSSADEEIARDFILFGRPDVTVIVVDGTGLERNLNLVLQVMQITDRVVVCLNLMDEAKRRGLTVDERRLSRDLGVPVVPTSARFGEGLDRLTETIAEVASGRLRCKPRRLGGKPRDVERAVSRLSERLLGLCPGLPNSEWVALRLLDGDESVEQAVRGGELADLAVTGDGDERSPGEPDPKPGARAEEILQLASRFRWQVGEGFHQTLMETIYAEAGRIADRTVTRSGEQPRFDLDRTIDRVVTNRILGFPLMLGLLALVFWITIAGANVPSGLLFELLLDTIHPLLKSAAAAVGMPWWLDGLLVDGVYLATAWVVAVMLPPMAIFFPLFTLLEDFGYLPRVAFNLDRAFKRVGAHGKQALTMTMGFGCNAAGVVATRIIDSPRERLIAILTNNFALCNGRWPTQILVASVFIGALVPAQLAGLVSALAVVAVAVLGALLSLLFSWLLSRTVLRGEVSTFTLELPPYRPPRVLQTIYTSLIDRTAFVLWRAVVFAVPAGAVIWLISNVNAGETSLAAHAIDRLEPLGFVLGLSGVILLAYVIAIPANEIVIPSVLMLTVMTIGATDAGQGAGVLFELESRAETAQSFKAGGWTLLTAVNLMLFSLVHNPCSTTIYTIWKETRNLKWTAISALMPLAAGLALCFLVAQVWRIVA